MGFNSGFKGLKYISIQATENINTEKR